MLLSMTGIDKAFSGNKVLNDVSFGLDAGEIVALLGANGAGKSTLMKIMTGLYSRDAGEIRVDGRAVEIASPADAMAEGIRLIPQELSILPEMSVAENVFLGAMPASGPGPLARIDTAAMLSQTRELLASLGLDGIDPAAQLGRLSVSEQRLVEIARALAGEARVLVMDEPTASLSERERERLFAIMRRLRERGTGIVFISHYLGEVFEVSDRISVLRDGLNAGDFVTARTDHDSVLSAMLGRAMEALFPAHASAPGEVVLAVEGLAGAGGLIAGVDLSVRRGEIHGVFGLIGSGVEALGKLLYGAVPPAAGTLSLMGRPFRPRGAGDAIASGVGYVAGERKAEGILPDLTVRENFTLPFLGRYVSGLSVSRRRETAFARKWIEALDVRTTGAEQAVRGLSGGNQQKLCIGRWLVDDLTVLILEEPTRGVDLGARRDIYGHLRRLSEAGLAVVVLSTDAEEVAGLADSVTVLGDGLTVRRFDAPATAEALMQAAGSRIAGAA